MATHRQCAPTTASVRFKVTPPNHGMENDGARLPADMRPFIQTPVAQPLIRGRNVAFGGSVAVAAVLFSCFANLLSPPPSQPCWPDSHSASTPRSS